MDPGRVMEAPGIPKNLLKPSSEISWESGSGTQTREEWAQKKRNLSNVVAFVGSFLWNTCLNNRFESSGELFASFWFNKTSVLLYEKPKHDIFMISGSMSPWETVFIDLNIPNYFKKTWENYGNMFETYYFRKSIMWLCNYVIENH